MPPACMQVASVAGGTWTGGVAGCREEHKHAKAKHGMALKELCIVRFNDTLTLGTCIRGGTHHSPLFEMCLQHGFLKMMKTYEREHYLE